MKKTVIIIIILVIIAGGYLGRHKLRSMIGMAPSPSPMNMSQDQMKAMDQNSAMAPTDNIYKVKTDTAKGKYITDFQGMTLYTYDKDAKGVSNCVDKCAELWPVYTSGATAQKTFPKNITVITRSDGSKQFAWKGMPLYYYINDKNPGEINGDGVGSVWHIIKM
jgi:predicted lipoprotein with Yx(FWY)xxD motif